jgi:hypothetical protein
VHVAELGDAGLESRQGGHRGWISTTLGGPSTFQAASLSTRCFGVRRHALNTRAPEVESSLERFGERGTKKATKKSGQSGFDGS